MCDTDQFAIIVKLPPFFNLFRFTNNKSEIVNW